MQSSQRQWAFRTADAQFETTRVKLDNHAYVLQTYGLMVHCGNAILARPADARPDAVFAANDLVAMGVLQALMMQGQGGLRVPQDIALIGYDDIDFASAAVVPLSSIRQPSALIGQTAVELLLAEAADPGVEPTHVVFTPELVVRASTRS